jgi:hypothetical protein
MVSINEAFILGLAALQFRVGMLLTILGLPFCLRSLSLSRSGFTSTVPCFPKVKASLCAPHKPNLLSLYVFSRAVGGRHRFSCTQEAETDADHQIVRRHGRPQGDHLHQRCRRRSEEAVSKMAKQLARHGELDFCYEASGCGYNIHRQLTGLGHKCTGAAPSMIPRKPGERIKTDRRDSEKLATLHRAGDLTPVWVPDTTHERFEIWSGHALTLPCT